MSVVMWGARRYDTQAGSPYDLAYADLQRTMTGNPLFRDAAVPLSTRRLGHQLRLAEFLRIRKPR